MPNIPLYRLWCKTCQDWTLHHGVKLFDEEKRCNSCKTIYASTELSEIPQEKIIEQRKRYIQSNAVSVQSILSVMAGMQTSEENIVENDAGQREINKKIAEQKAEQKRIKAEQKRIKDEEIPRFKDVGRNDLCLCGSGKKYKKCCLQKH